MQWITPKQENHKRLCGVVIAVAERNIPRGVGQQYVLCWDNNIASFTKMTKKLEIPRQTARTHLPVEFHKSQAEKMPVDPIIEAETEKELTELYKSFNTPFRNQGRLNIKASGWSVYFQNV